MGTIERGSFTPLVVEGVIVLGPASGELRAVQDASQFASFSRRWLRQATAERALAGSNARPSMLPRCWGAAPDPAC